MATVASLVIDVQANTARLQKGLDKANKNTKRWADQSKKRAQSVDGAFKNLRRTVVGLGVVFAGKRLFGNAISESADLEEAVISLGRVTDRSLEDIQQQISGLDPILGTATELTKGFYQVLSAGVRDPLKSVELLTTASQAAKVAQIEQSEVIKGLTKIMAGFEGQVKDAAEAADLLFTIEREGQTTVAELVPVIGSLAKVSKDLGVESKELGAALAQITQTAGSTEEAAVQLQGVFLGLLKPTVDMKSTIKELGFESTEAAIAQLGFADTLKLLKDSTQGSAEQMAKLFSNVRGLKGLSALASQDFEKLNEKIEAMSTGVGSAQRAFDDWKESTNALFTTIKSQFNAVLIDLGQSILPLVNDQLNDVSDWLKSNRDELKKAFDGAAKGAKVFLDNLDLIVAAAKVFISLKLAFFVGALAEKALLAAAAFKTLGIAITSTNAIGIIIVGTFSAIQGALFLANKELDRMEKSFKQISFDNIEDGKKKFEATQVAIKNTVSQLGQMEKELMDLEALRFLDPQKFEGVGKIITLKQNIEGLRLTLSDLEATGSVQAGILRSMGDAALFASVNAGILDTQIKGLVETLTGAGGAAKVFKDPDFDLFGGGPQFDPELDIAQGIADMIEFENEAIRTGLERQEDLRRESMDRQLDALNDFFVGSQQQQLQFEQWEIQQVTAQENAKKQIKEAALTTVLGSFASFFQQVGQQNEAAFTAFKAFAIAQVSIDTIRAVQAAIAWGTSTGSPFLGAALGAAAAASGAARVAQIASMQPGSTVSADTGTGGISGATSGTSAAEPQVIDAEPTRQPQQIVVNVQGSVVTPMEIARVLIPFLDKARKDGVR